MIPHGFDTAMVVTASIAKPGGAAIRWRSLLRALEPVAPCLVHEVGCERWQGCRWSCAREPDTPGRGGTHGVRQADSLAGDAVSSWFYDRLSCDRYADDLAGALSAAGVSTVICSGVEAHHYVRRLSGRPEFTVVFDMHNVELALHRSIRDARPDDALNAAFYSAAHVAHLAEVEAAAIAAAGAVWVCSDDDRRLTLELYPDTAPGKVHVVPNAVDMPARCPPPAEIRRVSFLGRFDYYPNVAAAVDLGTRIAPRLIEIGHRLPVVVAGAMAGTALLDHRMPETVRVVSNPPGVRDVIAGSIMAVPLTLGGGSRLKVLEAFAFGAPVVSTAKGVEGLDLVDGEHYLRATGAGEFAAAIDRLLRDPALRARLVTAAWRHAAERFSTDALARGLHAALPGALQRVAR